MTALYPLAIHPWPLPAHELERIKRIFIGMNAPFPVEPRPAVPGGPVRVLALGSLPPFVCDTWLVPDRSDESLAIGLRWVLDGSQPLDKGHTVLAYLRSIFGPQMRELEPWECLEVEEQVQREEERRVRFV